MNESVMSFGDHLVELRRRIIFSLIAVVAAFILIFFVFEGRLIDAIRWPFERAKSWMDQADYPNTDLKTLSLMTIEVTEVFIATLKLAFVGAVVISVPIWLYQVWMFVAPGLKIKERKAVFPALFFGTLLFATGAAMAYFVVIPFAMRFFLVYNLSMGIVPQWTFGKFVGFQTMIMLVFGIAFELPLVITLLTLVGIVTPKMLTSKRRYAILIMFILGAVFTPQDVFTQLMLAGPLIMLYEISIILSRVFYKRRWRAFEAYEDDGGGDEPPRPSRPRPSGEPPDDGVAPSDTAGGEPPDAEPAGGFTNTGDPEAATDDYEDHGYENDEYGEYDYSYEQDYMHTGDDADETPSEYGHDRADYDETPGALPEHTPAAEPEPSEYDAPPAAYDEAPEPDDDAGEPETPPDGAKQP